MGRALGCLSLEAVLWFQDTTVATTLPARQESEARAQATLAALRGAKARIVELAARVRAIERQQE